MEATSCNNKITSGEHADQIKLYCRTSVTALSQEMWSSLVVSFLQFWWQLLSENWLPLLKSITDARVKQGILCFSASQTPTGCFCKVDCNPAVKMTGWGTSCEQHVLYSVLISLGLSSCYSMLVKRRVMPQRMSQRGFRFIKHSVCLPVLWLMVAMARRSDSNAAD